MKETAAKNVDEYLELLPAKTRKALESLRQTIRIAAPKAEETISYQMPAYKYFGPLVYFAAFKNHCSFFPASKLAIEVFKKDLASYETAAGTIHFTPERPLPASLVKKIVRFRIKTNEEKNAVKKLEAASKKTKK
jgi:uncharacterized protein YdhG (YjbR/CyaY superfamily)